MDRHLSHSSALLLSSLAVVPLLSLISPSPFLAYFRSAPTAPSPMLPLLSLSTARPTPLRSPVVFLPAWWPRSATLLLAVPRFPPPAPPASDFPATHGFPPPPLFRFYLFMVGFFFSYGPGVGVGVPPPSEVTTSPVNSTAMHVLLPLPLTPPLGLPLTRLPPLSLRLWVFQQILRFLPLLPVSRVLYLSLLTPRLLRWPWCLRTPPTVVFSSTFVHCYLYRLGCLLLHHFRLYSFSTSWLLRL